METKNRKTRKDMDDPFRRDEISFSVSLPPNGGPRWFSLPEGFYGVTAAQAAVSVIPAKAAVQTFKAED